MNMNYIYNIEENQNEEGMPYQYITIQQENSNKLKYFNLKFYKFYFLISSKIEHLCLHTS